MREKLSVFGIILFIVVVDFWPLVIVPVVAIVVTDWGWLGIVSSAVGIWFLWDFVVDQVDDDDEPGGHVFGYWRRHRQRVRKSSNANGYSAD